MAKKLEIRIDKAIRALIPPLATEEREQLEENIKVDGCRDPVVIWSDDHIILDGHNRHEICEKYGYGYKVVEIDIPSRDAAMAWVIRNQFGRRNLNDFQRVELALKLKEFESSIADARKKSGKKPDLTENSPQGRATTTDEKIGIAAGVSDKTVRQVEQVVENAIPEIQEMARTNDISINAAATVANAPKAEQKKAAAAGVDGVKDLAKEMRDGKKEEEKKQEVPAEDETGMKITSKKVVAAFALKPEAKEIIRQLRALEKISLDYANRLSGFIEVQNLKIAFKNLRKEFEQNWPYAVCRKCEGRGCAACSQHGYQSEYRWNTVVESEFKK